ncbi:hypothetical protein [Flavobacterium sp. PL11]
MYRHNSGLSLSSKLGKPWTLIFKYNLIRDLKLYN